MQRRIPIDVVRKFPYIFDVFKELNMDTAIQTIEEASTVTAKGQTTIPKSVRNALGVGPGDQIAFRVNAAGVSLHRAETPHEDPALNGFLDFLAKDIAARPAALTALTPELAQRLADLTYGVDVDLDEVIDGEV
jgi:antitoxin PrlF